jgi:hypothetical protein
MSKEIAQDFIQSILFVDDKAYCTDQGDHRFEVKPIIRESATKGLIATAFAPEHQDDLSMVVSIGRKADVVVLDWRIDVNDFVTSAGADEEQDDVADSRGDFAIQVIKKLIVENEVPVDQLKLIFIYTGETNLRDIFTQLITAFSSFKQIDEFTLSFGGVRISIWAKDCAAPSFSHMPEIIPRIRSYSGLLEEVPIEYAKVSSGLLSNTCLNALTLLRNNTYKLIANFSPSLDPAFVAHRAMLPQPEDAGDLLKETICGQMNAILTNADISQQVSSKIICDWLSSQEFNDTAIKATDKHNITIDSTKRYLWQNKGYVALLNGELNASGKAVLNDDDIKNFERARLKKYACQSFKPHNYTNEYCNEEFSILTHHKRNHLSTSQLPSLSLGVMLKYNDSYLLCIQQKCDSVRIEAGTHRKFLFLTMEKDEKNFDVLFKDESQSYVHLSTCYKECHALEIIEFAPFDDTGIVQAQKEDAFYYFKGGPNDDKNFQWILDLKEAHAQRIANKFAANLARVGLDESEWLRRN